MTASRAPLRDSPLWADGLLALGLTALSVVTLLAGATDVGSYSPSSILLLLVQTLSIAFRRVAPFPVLGVTVGATVLHAMQAGDSLNSTLGSLIALFTVAERYDRRISGLAAIAYGLVLGILIADRVGLPQGLGSLIQNELSVAVAWVLGTWSRERRAYVGTVEDRAARAEREREERARLAVVEERQRIARELHDVVAHHVSVIVVQSGAARRALDMRPDDARAAIDAIDSTARQALGDMRRMVGVLGTSVPGGTSPDGTSLEPMPSLERLGPLIESVRAAGLPVELSIEGEPRPLDPGVELSAYRIIQEALTNTLKHAGGGRARVLVRYAPTTLDVRVTDEGGSRPVEAAPDSGGHGLVGMRERVAVFGGTLEAGPAAGGFRVAARLPLDGSAA